MTWQPTGFFGASWLCCVLDPMFYQKRLLCLKRLTAGCLSKVLRALVMTSRRSWTSQATSRNWWLKQSSTQRWLLLAPEASSSTTSSCLPPGPTPPTSLVTACTSGRTDCRQARCQTRPQGHAQALSRPSFRAGSSTGVCSHTEVTSPHRPTHMVSTTTLLATASSTTTGRSRSCTAPPASTQTVKRSTPWATSSTHCGLLRNGAQRAAPSTARTSRQQRLIATPCQLPRRTSTPATYTRTWPRPASVSAGMQM
mmetsp:Transcript_3138/g.6887  ORF Transcript_3138/g.6887 Transcript_3138/m.6887 type:complete len:254 (-) Transcript_3138:1454-2215(-)